MYAFSKKLILIITLAFLYIVPANAFSTQNEHETDSLATSQEVAHSVESDSHDEHHAPHLDGKTLSLWWLIPFVGILLSIAVFPLVAPHFWHNHYGKISLFWGVLFFVMFTIFKGINMSGFYLAEVYLGEFIPFIVLLLALFTVGGGIRLKGELIGSPKLNTGLILIGTILASWMGTTGAAMLMIRPVIRANAWRKNQKHVIIFFIFLVANIGGSLTPLGDPPLFLGFLKGVSFFWTTTHMFLPMLFEVVVLIIVFFVIDSFYYKKETNKPTKKENGEKFGIEGSINFLFLAGIIAAVIFSGIWHPNIAVEEDWSIVMWGTGLMTKGTLAQVLILLGLTFLSLKFTPESARKGNGFTWEPIVEVAKLFATIFITMVPPIAMLKAGSEGPLGAIINSVRTSSGEFVDSAFFWATGILSSFLDNAPTYVVFFNTALGESLKVGDLMTTYASTLLAISAGAVFMGANTYIGNAPNFMVKSIAEENEIKMPSFFGYMAWSVAILVPTFVLVTLIFF
ncbi:MAG: sodium:proton antiporter [Calditrichaeota bacterium]|nr:MAG: sodium:proton antiporter [Calditrichota bacterium]MBL1204373.1 sodium:proton antiporter [Calditrichota bacterium]NOG44202.1 sodium:proton antiporter [Calditrichota bacterium]